MLYRRARTRDPINKVKRCLQRGVLCKQSGKPITSPVYRSTEKHPKGAFCCICRREPATILTRKAMRKHRMPFFGQALNCTSERSEVSLLSRSLRTCHLVTRSNPKMTYLQGETCFCGHITSPTPLSDTSPCALLLWLRPPRGFL